MALTDCVAEITKAAGEILGEAISQDAIYRILDSVDQRAKIIAAENASLSKEEQLSRAAAELSDEAKAVAIIERANAIRNLRKRVERREFYSDAPDPILALEAKLVGVNAPWKGSRESVYYTGQALLRKYYGFGIELDKAGLGSVVRRGLIDDQWGKELYELSLGSRGNPGVTGNKDAQKIAEIVHKWQRISVDDLNREGAWVGTYEGYISRTMHDWRRLEKAGYQEWRNGIMPLLDHERTFENVGDVDKFMFGVYNGLITGVHMTHEGLQGFKAPAFKGPGNLAKHLSQSRVLHFKDAESWLSYRKQFGPPRALINDVMGGFESAARSVAIMKHFGTNPRYEFDADFRWLQEKYRDTDPKLVNKLNASREMLENRMKVVDGRANMPVNRMWADIYAGVRMAQGMAKLGSALFSSLSDIGYHAAELRYQGANILERYGSGLSSVFRGRRMRGETGRIVADQTRAGLEGMIGHIASRFDPSLDSAPGMVSALANAFFRWSGLTFWTDTQKTGAQHWMARNLGRQRNKTWQDLEPEERRILTMHGMDSRQWDMIRSVNLTMPNGQHYVTPDAAYKVRDSSIDDYLGERVSSIKNRPDVLKARADEQAAKEAVWIKKRVDKLRTKQEKALARLANLELRRTDRAGKQTEVLRARSEALMARLEEAETEVDLFGSLRGIDVQERLRQMLDRAETGEGAFDIATQSDRAVERFARTTLHAGENLGARRQRLKTKSKDALKRADRLESELVQKLDEENERVRQALIRREEEVVEFIDRVRERQRERLEAVYAAFTMIEPRLARLRDNFRNDLAVRLLTYFTDRGDFAVPTPGGRERAIMHQGTRPGTRAGEFFRFAMQFKAFPIAAITKSLGREIYGGQGRWSAVSGVTQLMLATLLLGYGAQMMKDLSKGRTPRDPRDPKTIIAALMQGGGMGIYGDFILGDWSRFGRSFLASLAGPTFGQIDDVAELVTRLRAGDDAASQAFRLMWTNMPYVNLFYTRMALDYLFLYQIQEALNPGSLRRMEARVLEDNSQTFMFPPSRAIPSGGGGRALEGIR